MSNFTAEEMELARKARNAKMREWRRKNPEKVKEHQLRHWIKVGMAEKGQKEELETISE